LEGCDGWITVRVSVCDGPANDPRIARESRALATVEIQPTGGAGKPEESRRKTEAFIAEAWWAQRKAGEMLRPAGGKGAGLPSQNHSDQTG
jgi:hypothetical protein